MTFSIPLSTLFRLVLTGLVSCGSSLPHSDTLTSPSPGLGPRACAPVEVARCAQKYSWAHMPNVYGDVSQEEAGVKLEKVLKSFTQPSDVLVTFFCTLYVPPCLESGRGSSTGRVPLPCLPMCQRAESDSKVTRTKDDLDWPIGCQTLPTENCYNFVGQDIAFVKTSMKALPQKSRVDDVILFAPLEVELGNGLELGNDEAYELEVVSLSDARIPARRYDTADLGDPNYFQGWVDVQGSGAANDYCRVIGKGKRRFLSCNLAGSSGQGHHYVSQLGFETGLPNTWFMRDMDGDGKDDYCRCLVSNGSSKITCMKAGERGFYGSTAQGGNQHTYSLPASAGCHSRRINPLFGE
ncbi:unnamed protein product [Lymnaea stagnalis]|uniref:FZ domain-containing protein n=1 Tax=Lymnaea stagnalis TaxID=6523 RepID=A0AAV2IEM7_LYMST